MSLETAILVYLTVEVILGEKLENREIVPRRIHICRKRVNSGIGRTFYVILILDLF